MINMEIEKEESSIPRPGSPLYNLTLASEEIKIKTLKKWKNLNKWLMIPLYRMKILPLFGLGKIFLLLITKGRITGKKRRTPLEYHRINDIITIFSARGVKSGWMKNILKHPSDVKVYCGFHSFCPKIEIMENNEKIIEIIKWYLVNCSRSSKMLFGWDPKNDDLESHDLSVIAKTITIVQLHSKS
jgi:hypothetical protein